MENFVEDTQEEVLVDLFDEQVSYAEDQAHLRQRRLKRQREGSPGQAGGKRQRREAVEHRFLEMMPSSDMYERSYMHKDILCSGNAKCLIVCSAGVYEI